MRGEGVGGGVGTRFGGRPSSRRDSETGLQSGTSGVVGVGGVTEVPTKNYSKRLEDDTRSETRLVNCTF